MSIQTKTNAISIGEIKLIAEFMEINVTDFIWNEHLGLVYCDEDGNFQIDADLQYYSPDRNWNDLMPVVEKIENLGKGFKFKICRKRVDIVEDWGTELFVLNTKGKSKIESVCLAVVEFIKWYKNKQI